MRLNPEQEAAVKELTSHGAIIVKIERGGKHPRIYFVYNGRSRFMTTAGSGSDWRGPQNARKFARRHLLHLGADLSKSQSESTSSKDNPPIPQTHRFG